MVSMKPNILGDGERSILRKRAAGGPQEGTALLFLHLVFARACSSLSFSFVCSHLMLFALVPLGGESERARRAVPVAALLVKPTCTHCAARHRAGVRSVGALAGGVTIS